MDHYYTAAQDVAEGGLDVQLHFKPAIEDSKGNTVRTIFMRMPHMSGGLADTVKQKAVEAVESTFGYC